MASVKIAFAAVCIAILIFKSEAASKCYNCTGDPYGDCAKAVGPMEVITCSGLSVCRYTDTRSGSIRSVSRGCTTVGPKDLCTVLLELSVQFPIGLTVFKCKTCSEDLCNVQVTR
ncbi:hypothetical protein FQR65_LT06270 [Abscondita terminalis]|nr:hypothetical protein FQR65_LT06270 [Abscondita terminalis]